MIGSCLEQMSSRGRCIRAARSGWRLKKEANRRYWRSENGLAGASLSADEEVVPEKENEFNIGGDSLKSSELEGNRREPLLPETKRSPDLKVGVGHGDLPAERL
ncbi:hypothetical protein L1887_10816 [Cichorium endivia]|nr:hypothetical protein L1887_10816 [Cichorium endivia]